jgi:hypothetical protein
MATKKRKKKPAAKRRKNISFRKYKKALTKKHGPSLAQLYQSFRKEEQKLVRSKKRAGRHKNESFRKFKKAAKKRAAARGEDSRLTKVHKIRKAVQHRSKKQDREIRRSNPRERSIPRAKTGRWYKGPRGTQVRVTKKRGKLLVQVR